MTIPEGYVEALWVGSYEAEIPGGLILQPGVTTTAIPAGEAEQSDNWQPVVNKKSSPPVVVEPPKENAE